MTTDMTAMDREVHELLSRLGVPESAYSDGAAGGADSDYGAGDCACGEDDSGCCE